MNPARLYVWAYDKGIFSIVTLIPKKVYKCISVQYTKCNVCYINFPLTLKPRPNALDFSLYIARQMSSIVECCRDGVAKRSRLFTRLGT